MGALVLFDARRLADDLRRATNNELVDFVTHLDSQTREWLTDRFTPDTGYSEEEIDDLERENGRLELQNAKLEDEIEKLEDRVAELEENPADCILLAWDIAHHPDPLKAANPADELAFLSQMISRAYCVAPEKEPSRGR